MKVLLADDSEVVCERLVTMLSEVEGVEIVGQARDAPQAIDAVRKLNPEVVILDIRMPGGSGIKVLQEIKKDGLSPIVIMLTNYSYLQNRIRCLYLGADFFFDKSTEFEKIPEVLKQLIPSPCT